jgi:hypothetical protein
VRCSNRWHNAWWLYHIWTQAHQHPRRPRLPCTIFINNQCCGTGTGTGTVETSVSDPESISQRDQIRIRIRNPVPDPGGQK